MDENISYMIVLLNLFVFDPLFKFEQDKIIKGDNFFY